MVHDVPVTGSDGRQGGVLVVGDANPDLVLRGDVVPRFGQAEQLLDDAALVLGGSAAITAHGFARLGRPVALLAVVGDDLFGRFAVDACARAGVDTRFIAVSEQHRTGVTVVLSTPDDRAILTLLGAIPALTADDVRATVAALRPRHVHISSFYLQPTLAADLAHLLAEIHTTGATTSLDTNADPAGTWLGVAELLPHLDLLLPNAGEVTALTGESDPAAAAAKLAQGGPVVVVKDGARGAVAVTPDGAVVAVPGVRADVVDTTGAGDTFNAAFVDTWLEHADLRHCLARAVRAGAFSVAAPGGTAGQPDRRDLDGEHT